MCVLQVTTSDAAFRKSHHPSSKNLSTKSGGDWGNVKNKGGSSKRRQLVEQLL